MWTFNVTPIGAFVNAVEAAEAKNRQEARHLREQPAPEQPKTRPARTAAILTRARALLGALHPAVRLRTKAP